MASTPSTVIVSLPPLVNLEDYHEHARLHLPKSVYDFYQRGAHDELTVADNIEAFHRILILPRYLIDVSRLSLTTSIIGRPFSSPIAIAPTAMQRMAHPHGELATARAAASRSVLMTLSSLSTTSLEEVAAVAPAKPGWYQLYVYRDRAIAESLVRRAEASGYTALILTVDTPRLGVREWDARNRFSLPSHLALSNFTSSTETVMEGGGGGSGLASYVNRLYDPSLSWKDVAWLRSITRLPIIIKGIMTAEDAELACEVADGLIVSNHGGRQLDSVAATIEVLPEVIAAVERKGKAGKVEVFLDGGVRRGSDVFKALALGARAVFIGRPVLWGLAYAGEDGVKQVLTILHNELELCMALAGCPTLASIHRNRLTTSEALRPKL